MRDWRGRWYARTRWEFPEGFVNTDIIDRRKRRDAERTAVLTFEINIALVVGREYFGFVPPSFNPALGLSSNYPTFVLCHDFLNLVYALLACFRACSLLMNRSTTIGGNNPTAVVTFILAIQMRPYP